MALWQFNDDASYKNIIKSFFYDTICCIFYERWYFFVKLASFGECLETKHDKFCFKCTGLPCLFSILLCLFNGITKEQNRFSRHFDFLYSFEILWTAKDDQTDNSDFIFLSDRKWANNVYLYIIGCTATAKYFLNFLHLPWIYYIVKLLTYLILRVTQEMTWWVYVCRKRNSKIV